MTGSLRAARARAGWLAAPGVVLCVLAGCGGEERPARQPVERAQPTATAGTQAPDDCPAHIDDLIADGFVPRADRDYAMDMCEAQR